MKHHTVSMRWIASLSIGLAMWIAAHPLAIGAQTISPIAAPLSAIASPVLTIGPVPASRPEVVTASTQTPEPTYTPLPTFTPLPTATLAAPIEPTTPAAASTLDSNLWPFIIGGAVSVLLLIVLLLVIRARRRRHLQSTQPVAPVSPLEATAVLEFTGAAGKVLSFNLDKTSMILGRGGDSDIVLPDSLPNIDTVSRQHARFNRDQDGFAVHDLESQNGLTVNGHHTNHNLLEDGDRIAFGSAEATFRSKS